MFSCYPWWFPQQETEAGVYSFRSNHLKHLTRPPFLYCPSCPLLCIIVHNPCYGLNVCGPLNPYIKILTPNVMALGVGPWRCLGYEGGALINGITKEIPQGHLGCSACWASAFSSGHDPRILGLSPTLGSLLGWESASPSLSALLVFSLSLSLK